MFVHEPEVLYTMVRGFGVFARSFCPSDFMSGSWVSPTCM